MSVGRLDGVLERLADAPGRLSRAVPPPVAIARVAAMPSAWDRPPGEQELDAASAAIAGWLAGRSFPPQSRHLDIAPLLFGSTRFLDDERFRKAFGHHLATERRPRALVRVLHAHFDLSEASAAATGGWLRAHLARHAGLSSLDPDVFDEEALTARFARHAFEFHGDVRRALAETAPAPGEMGEQSALARRLCSRLPEMLGMAIVEGQGEPAILANALAQLQEMQAFAPTERAPLAKTLLERFRNTSSRDRDRDAVVATVRDLLGDPTEAPDPWAELGPDLRKLIGSWSPRQVLELGFEIMAPVDDLEPWKSRFWLALVDQGVIDEATLALGGPALDRAKGSVVRPDLGEAVATIANTVHDTGILLMRGPAATFAEWSPSGKCRIWLAGNAATPRLADARYDVRVFRTGADFEQAHSGSSRGVWQRELLAFMGVAGIHVPDPAALIPSG